ARVGRDHAEQRRRSHTVGQHLVHVRMLEKAQAGATILGRKMWRPEARLLYLVLDRLPHLPSAAPLLLRRAVAPARPQLALVGHDIAVDDLRRERADLVDPGVERPDGLHVHMHGGFLCGLKRSMATPSLTSFKICPLRTGPPAM